MKIRTIITVVLAVLAAGAAWTHHARQSAAAETAVLQQPLLDKDELPVEAIDRITVTRRDETPLVFERQDGDREWAQVEPLVHPVDTFSMHQTMAVAREMIVTGTIDPGDGDPATSPAALSLDPPLATVRFDWDGGSLTLESGRRGIAGRAYVRRSGDSRVFITGPALFERIVAMDPREWRDRHLFPDASVEADRIELFDGATRIALESDRKHWSMTEPVRTRLDATALDGLVQALAHAQSGGFLVDLPEDLGSYGLDAPAGSIAVTTTDVTERDGVIERTPRTTTLLVGPRMGASQDRFGMIEGGDTVFRISASLLPTVFRSAEQLIDPTASGAQPADVKSIKFRVDGKEWSIERDLDRWYDPSRQEEVPISAVAELLGQLTMVRAPRVRIQDYPRELEVGIVTLYGFDALPLDTVRIAREPSTGEWALENGDGVLRILPGSAEVKLLPGDYGIAEGP